MLWANAGLENIILARGQKNENSSSESDDESQEDSDHETLTMEKTGRSVTPTPVRALQVPRRLRFRDETPELESQSVREEDRPIEINSLNQHLEALHLGRPGQRRPITPIFQSQPSRLAENNYLGSNAILEKLMRKDQEMKLLRKAKLKNTTVKGKVRELVRYGEQMKISAESVDSHILAEFGLHGGRT